MRRLCFLLPDVTSAHHVVDDLRQQGTPDSDIYVLARAGTDLGDLPDAGATESDAYPQLRRGLATGATIGLIGGLIAVRVAGAVFGGAAVALFTLLGAGFSGVLSAMAGAAFPNSRLAQFESAIDAGQILVMVDASKERLADVERLVRRRHPEIVLETLEPHASVVPTAPP